MNDIDGDLMRRSLANAGEEADEESAVRRKARFEASIAKLETDPAEQSRIDSIAAAAGLTGKASNSEPAGPRAVAAGGLRSASPDGGLATPDLGPAMPYRPAAPGHGLGRWLRMCAGIREHVLDWVPEERARYAALGFIILATAGLAAFGMFSALDAVVAEPAVVLAIPALAWGWINFSVDRWLITTMHGVRQAKHLRSFLPRLALVALLSVAIAEPLTLRIFHNAIDAQARTAQIDAYASQLQACNPVSGHLPRPAGCASYVLSVPGSPYAATQQLATARQQQAQLQQAVSADTTQLQKLTSISREECSGSPGPGTTGIAGVGPMCQADRAATLAYAQQSGLAAQQKQLATLQTSIAGMIQQAGDVQQTYTARLSTAITHAVAEKRKEPGPEIGIIDEEAALQQLSAQSTFVLFTRWLLGLALVTLSCLPMLTQLISGSTVYDRLLTEQLAADERIYLAYLQHRERAAEAEKEQEEPRTRIAAITMQDRIRDQTREQRIRNSAEPVDMAAAAQALMDLLAPFAAASEKERGTGGPQVPAAAQGLRETEDAGSP